MKEVVVMNGSVEKKTVKTSVKQIVNQRSKRHEKSLVLYWLHKKISKWESLCFQWLRATNSTKPCKTMLWSSLLFWYLFFTKPLKTCFSCCCISGFTKSLKTTTASMLPMFFVNESIKNHNFPNCLYSCGGLWQARWQLLHSTQD